MDTVVVNRAALKEVLEALIGPPHLIRELQALMSFHGGSSNPINILIEDYNRGLDNGR